MGKKVKHMDMIMTEEEDKKWHKRDEIPRKTPVKSGQKLVNPFAIGGGFLGYCVSQGWLIKERVKEELLNVMPLEKVKKKSEKLVLRFRL